MKTKLRETLLGRVLTRLVGEETGAVMMEYVVLAVLLVGAVVGAAIVFGGRIAHRFEEAGLATTGSQTAVESAQTANNGTDSANAAAAYGHQTTISGGDYNFGGGAGQTGGGATGGNP